MNKKTAIILGSLIGMIMSVYMIFIVVDFEFVKDHRMTMFWMGTIFMVANISLIFVGYYAIKARREVLKRSFDFYVESLISISGVGMISFNEDRDIIWISKFIESRIRKHLIGKKIDTISESFSKEFSSGSKQFRFEVNGIIYESNVNLERQIIILKDVSKEETILSQYSSEKLILGEFEIDNFQQLQVVLAEEELFKIQSYAIRTLDNLVDKYNLVYRQYVNGKFLLIFDQVTLDKFVKDKFNFLDNLRKVNIIDGIKLTASIGIGAGSSAQKELIEMAKDGLMQAQARGGDQVGLVYANGKPKYFGSKSEIAKTVSRVKIKQTTELFEKKIASPLTKRVIIYGHKNADLDAVGASMGVADIAKSYGKEVYIQNQTFDNTTSKAMKSLTLEEREMFIKTNKAFKLSQQKGTIIVIVDTGELDRIENPKALDNIEPENIFIFDHHRISKLPDGILQTNSYIDTTASSASEIVVEMLQFTKIAVKLSKTTLQMLLNGIVLDTNQFQKAISSRTFAAASYLEKYGAQSSIATELFKLTEDDSRLVNDILSNIIEVKPGFFLAAYSEEVPGDVISIAADEILRTHGRKAAFVICRVPNSKDYKLSARSIDVNVQIIAEMVGGGGHFVSAAAISSEPLGVFKDNVVQAIISAGGDR